MTSKKNGTKIVLALLTALVTARLWSPASTAHAQSNTQGQVLVLLADDDTQQLARVQDFVREHGGRNIHVFPQQAVVAWVSPSTIQGLEDLPGVAGVFTEAVEPSAVHGYDPNARRFVGVWNSLVAPEAPLDPGLVTDESHQEDGELEAHDDAFVAPDLPATGDIGARGPSIASSIPVTPGYYQTSEFMAGSVAVGIVLVESDGSVDPSTENWTADEKQQVFDEIVAALNWWAELEPQANLSFVYDDHFSDPLPTSVEPISRPYADQKYWIADAMDALGYDAEPYFTRVRDYTNDLRTTYGTDWAFTMFVIDSSRDYDNRFSDGYFAYAYLGGPFMVMTYGNNGYGPNNMDAVAAHEIGHIFLALDQYASAGQPCDRRSGYLYVENQNSVSGDCASDVDSIMRGGIGPYRYPAIDEYAAGQIGWRDSDGDGILDPLDTGLPVTISAVSVEGSSIVVSGTTEIIPYPSLRPRSITINTLTGVQYRFDGGEWRDALANDGTFDGTAESFSFADTLSSGWHTLEIAGVDSAGNVSDVYATRTIAVMDPIDGGLNTELREQHLDDRDVSNNEMVTISGVAYHLERGIIADVQYRVDGSSWQSVPAQDGAFDSAYEPFTLQIDSLEPGTHLIEARAIDGDGQVEVNCAAQEVTVARRTSTMFLPVVLGGV